MRNRRRRPPRTLQRAQPPAEAVQHPDLTMKEMRKYLHNPRYTDLDQVNADEQKALQMVEARAGETGRRKR